MQIKLHDFDEGALNGLEERSPADAMRILEVFRTSNPQEKDNKCAMINAPKWTASELTTHFLLRVLQYQLQS